MCHEGAGPAGYLMNRPVSVIDGQRGAVGEKLCHIMSTSGCFLLVHSNKKRGVGEVHSMSLI